MRPSMKDIAELAGASRPAVSAVLNGSWEKSRISETTRARILEAARKLGFRRNELAAAVKSGRSKTVAFIGGARASYVMELLAGLNAAAAKEGWTLKIFDLASGGSVEELAAQCVGQMVDGVVCRSLDEESLAALRAEFEPRGIPVVLVDNSFPNDWSSRVVSDDVSGAKLAVSHLAELGRKRLGFVGVPGQRGYASARREGFLKGLKKAGLRFDEALEIEVSDLSQEDGSCVEALAVWLRKAKPDAALCVSDSLAMRLLQACRAAGVEVPEKLAVVGYSDQDFAKLSIPPLSSVAQPFFEMGERAFQELSNLLEGGERKDVKLPVRLVERESSARSGRKTKRA